MKTKKLLFSAPDWCFYKEEYDPLTHYQRIHDAGCSAAEMVDPSRWDMARYAGLKLLNASAEGMYEGFNDRANHAALLDSTLRQVETLSANGVENLIVFSGARKEGLSDEEAYGNCLDAFGKLLDGIRGSGVCLQFEMLNSKDHPGYQADREEFGFRLARDLDDPCFKVLYDIYHMAVSGDDLLDGLAAKLPFIGHVHIAGLKDRGEPSEDCGIDYPTIVRALVDAGYEGYFGMEFISHRDCVSDLAVSIGLFRSYVY